jgi:hypothetical protein
MKAIISRTVNGAWVRFTDKDAPEPVRAVDMSYQFETDIGDNLDGLREMLYEIIERLGFVGDRYDKERISIKIEHGDKFMCEDKQCTICGDAR